jgi:5S rRNA maturation endonuclease (ribonuclease M5)
MKIKTSELIRYAKRYLWDGYTTAHLFQPDMTEYICHALETAGERRKQNKKALAVMVLIDSRLNGRTLRQWVARRLRVKSEYDLPTVDVQRHRLQWMELLAKEYEAKGD